MAFDRRPLSSPGDDRRRWTTPDSATALPGRKPLGVKQGCTLERFTNTLSVARHVLASPQGVDRSGHLPASLVAATTPARRVEIDPLGRNDGRRDVFPGQKGGFCVGKTK